jgi:hypothetical protein
MYMGIRNTISIHTIVIYYTTPAFKIKNKNLNDNFPKIKENSLNDCFATIVLTNMIKYIQAVRVASVMRTWHVVDKIISLKYI